MHFMEREPLEESSLQKMEEEVRKRILRIFLSNLESGDFEVALQVAKSYRALKMKLPEGSTPPPVITDDYEEDSS